MRTMKIVISILLISILQLPNEGFLFSDWGKSETKPTKIVSTKTTIKAAVETKEIIQNISDSIGITHNAVTPNKPTDSILGSKVTDSTEYKSDKLERQTYDISSKSTIYTTEAKRTNVTPNLASESPGDKYRTTGHMQVGLSTSTFPTKEAIEMPSSTPGTRDPNSNTDRSETSRITLSFKNTHNPFSSTNKMSESMETISVINKASIPISTSTESTKTAELRTSNNNLKITDITFASIDKKQTKSTNEMTKSIISHTTQKTSIYPNENKSNDKIQYHTSGFNEQTTIKSIELATTISSAGNSNPILSNTHVTKNSLLFSASNDVSGTNTPIKSMETMTTNIWKDTTDQKTIFTDTKSINLATSDVSGSKSNMISTVKNRLTSSSSNELTGYIYSSETPIKSTEPLTTHVGQEDKDLNTQKYVDTTDSATPVKIKSSSVEMKVTSQERAKKMYSPVSETMPIETTTFRNVHTERETQELTTKTSATTSVLSTITNNTILSRLRLDITKHAPISSGHSTIKSTFSPSKENGKTITENSPPRKFTEIFKFKPSNDIEKAKVIDGFVSTTPLNSKLPHSTTAKMIQTSLASVEEPYIEPKIKSVQDSKSSFIKIDKSSNEGPRNRGIHRVRVNAEPINKRLFTMSTPLATTTGHEIKVYRSQYPWLTRDLTQPSNLFHPVCTLDLDEGTGSETFSSWFYNEVSRRCEWFSYRGEDGNGNRFNYRGNCENYCIGNQQDLCLRSDIVNCEERWLNCKMISDLVCQDDSERSNKLAILFCPPEQPICVSRNNKFRRPPLYLTHRSMVPRECNQDKDPGKCHRNSNSVLLFYYDNRYNDCFGFLYSKCGGNSNRFATKELCMNQCAF